MYSRILQTLLLLLLPLIRAAVMNRTIDDTYGDLITRAKPIYLPDPWQNSSCGGCAIQPPVKKAFMETYSAFTYMEEKFPSMSIQFSFQGTAVYVYFILANFVNDGVTTETLCDFYLDGVNVSRFHHEPTSSREYQFNALAFSKDNLPNNNHTLLISTSGVNRHLFTSFDYANYTFDDTPATPATASSSASQLQSPTNTPTPSGNSHSAPIGAIVGGAIGGVLILGIILVMFLCLLRRRRHRSFLSSPAGNLDGSFATRGLPPLALTQGTVIEPHTFMSNSRRPTLPPAYNASATLNDETSSISIGSMRQAEIEDQIRGLTREMQALAGVKNDSKEDLEPPRISPSFSFRRSRRERAYMAQIQQQMDAMRAEIEYLQAQLHSGWAHGLTDDPPPSYSVVVPGNRGRDMSIRFS